MNDEDRKRRAVKFGQWSEDDVAQDGAGIRVNAFLMDGFGDDETFADGTSVVSVNGRDVYLDKAGWPARELTREQLAHMGSSVVGLQVTADASRQVMIDRMNNAWRDPQPEDGKPVAVIDARLNAEQARQKMVADLTSGWRNPA